MKTLKVRLAFPSGKPVNFRFGEQNIAISPKGTVIEARLADLIFEQLPGWIELVPKKAARPKGLSTAS